MAADCVARVSELDEVIERECEAMHDRYEAAAAEAGWKTQERSRVPWSDVPEANKVTMRAAIRPLVEENLRLRKKLARRSETIEVGAMRPPKRSMAVR